MKKHPKEEDRPLLSGDGDGDEAGDEACRDESSPPPPPYPLGESLARSGDGGPPTARRRRLRRFLAATLFFVVAVGLMSRWCAGKHHRGLPHDDKLAKMGNTHTTCLTAPHPLLSETYPVNFSPSRSLEITQKPRHSGHGAVTVRGSVSVHRAEPGEDGRVTVDAAASSRDLEVEVSWDEKSQALLILTPSVGFGGLVRMECVEVRVAVYAPAGAELDGLLVQTVSLGVLLAEGVGLDAERLGVSVVSGQIEVHGSALSGVGALDVAAVSGEISADLPVAAHASVKTTAGPITLTLHPPTSKRRDLSRSDLRVRSTSGAIRAQRAPADDDHPFPAVEYTNSITSKSGRIDVALGFTTRTEVTSLSGFIRADLTPVLPAGWSGSSGLHTESTSGSVDLTVRQPVRLGSRGGEEGGESRGGGAQFTLASRHMTVSGNQRITLPESWEGRFTARSLSGRVDVAGSGIDFLAGADGGRGRLGKTVRGKRGSGQSEAEVEATSGNVNLYIG